MSVDTEQMPERAALPRGQGRPGTLDAGVTPSPTQAAPELDSFALSPSTAPEPKP